MADIKRIDSLQECPGADPLFILRHTAFLVGESVVSFEILTFEQAVIHGDQAILENQPLLEEVIREFRFYSFHVTQFLDKQHRLLRSFPPVALQLVEIDSLQPSQFYVNLEKMEQCAQWIENVHHLIIPVRSGTNYICDGHTRLYAALQKGILQCYIYDAEDSGDYLLDFVKMARERNIFHVSDLQSLSDSEYKALWWQFCDNYFAQKE